MKKNLKKLICMLGVSVLMMSVFGCGSGGESAAPAETETTEETAEAPKEEQEEQTEENEAEPAEEAPEETGESEGAVSAETLKETANEEYEIAVIQKNLTNPIWIALQEGALAAGEEAGVKVTVLSPNTPESNEEQISLIEQQIAKGVDALVVIPADGTGIVPAIEEANAAGIPVINGDTRIDTATCSVDTFIAVENYNAAVAVAEELVSMMGEEGDVIILEGKAGTQTSIDLVGGANDVFDKYENVNVVASQAANWSRTDGYTVTLNLLEANPDAVAIFAANDEMAMGALQAVSQAGKEGQILIAGLNANPDAMEAVDAGQLALTFDKNGYLQGYSEVMAAVKKLNGGELESAYEVPGFLYTK